MLPRDREHEQREQERENLKRENVRRKTYNELLVKILQRMSPDEIQQYGERLIRRYFERGRH